MRFGQVHSLPFKQARQRPHGKKYAKTTRSPTLSGSPLESVCRPSPRAAIRPVPSWPWWIGSARPRLAGSRSPRQVCRSDPHTLASVMRTTAAPGSGSGTGYSLISSGTPTPRKTAALPVDAMLGQSSVDQFVGELGVVALDHTAIAVRSIQAALPLYRDLLGGVPNGFERLSERGFSWLTLRYPNGSQVELLEPAGTSGFLHEFLGKRGEGAHHM